MPQEWTAHSQAGKKRARAGLDQGAGKGAPALPSPPLPFYRQAFVPGLLSLPQRRRAPTSCQAQEEVAAAHLAGTRKERKQEEEEEEEILDWKKEALCGWQAFR